MHKTNACIPMPAPVFRLSEIFKKNNFQLYAVGGAVRDFVHGQGPYEPKDVDLCTDAEPKQVGEMLDRADIRNFPKGESFGVWVAHIVGEDFEIATFREDMVSSDGRRPDEVRFVDLAADYKRRDMTMNALYYAIPNNRDGVGEIIDFGENGIGMADAAQGRVRIIGNPFDRFGEDRLRILRVPRFHAQHSVDDIESVLDEETRAAMKHYGDLRKPVKRHSDGQILQPVSGERIQQEFLRGIFKAKSLMYYLEAYHKLGLLPSVFPGLVVSEQFEYLFGRNPVVVLAHLLRNNPPHMVRKVLTACNWPNDITDEVQYLLNVWVVMSKADRVLADLVPLVEKIDLKPERRRNVKDFWLVLNVDEINPGEWGHFMEYEPEPIDGEELMRIHNISGPAVGKMKLKMQIERFEKSYLRAT